MPRNEFFEKFAKTLQENGMPLSSGIIFNNLHNQAFLDKTFETAVSLGLPIKKEDLISRAGIGTITQDYQLLDGKGKKINNYLSQSSKVTPQQPKPTAVVPNFNIPSVVKDSETKTQLINSPSPQKAKIKEEDIVSPYYKGIKPDYSQQGTEDARLPTDKELSDFQSNEILKSPTLQTINKGIKNNTFIDPSIETDYLKALSFSDDDLLADNETFNAKHDVVYGKTQSDEDYEIAQGKNDIGQKYKTEKQKIDNQYNLINTKINYLNKYIGEKYGSANILDDLDLDNKDLNTKLAKLESIKKSKQPILNDLQSQINLLNENQRLYPISENEYSAQFAFLKAKYDSEAKSINDEIKAIQETQKNFQDKYNDPAISSLLKLRQKAYDVSVQGMSLIDNPIFEKVKKREDEAKNNQLLIDAKKKLELQLQNKEISFNEYSKYVENLDKAKNIGVNDQAFIVDKTMKLFKDIFTLPRTISGNVENNYGRVDMLADWATRVSERTTQKFPYSSNLQVNTFQKFAEVDGLRVLLDEKGNAYDVRDNNYFSINPIQAEKTIEKYKGNPQEYKKFNQTNVDVLAKNSLSTIVDVGVMILGTKGLGAVAGGGRVASTLIGAGVIFTQTHADTYQQGLDAGLNPQQSAQYASLISGGISLISFINPVEYKLAGGGGLFNSIKSNAISNADVALINSGKLSIGEVAKKHTIGIIKNIGGENLEEMVFEPIMQDYVSNMYSKKAEKGFEKQFDPISKQGLETFIITTATAIPFGIAEVNSEMPNYQAEALVTAIENPSTYMQVLQKRKEMGIISEIQMEQQIVQMDEISAIYNSVADDIKENDKAILAGLLAKKNVVTNKIKEIGDNVLSKKWNDTLSKIDEDIQSIVDGVETKNNLVGKGATETNEEVVQEVTQQEKPIKVFSDFDNTLFDPTTQTLTPLGEEMKLRIEAGEDIEIVTARENTKENVDLIAGQLGIDPSKITLGLTPEMKAEKVDEFEGKSQFIDDNTDNLQAVEGLGNDNVEVVPIVSKKQSFANKLAEKAKANKETKKIEKEQLEKSQEIPLNEKGEVDLPKIAADAIEVKTEVEEGSVGVGGDKKTNTVNGYEFTKTPTLTEKDGLKVTKLSNSEADLISKQIFISDKKQTVKDGITNEGGGWYSFDTNSFGGKTLYNKETGEAVELDHNKGGRMGVIIYDFVKNNDRTKKTFKETPKAIIDEIKAKNLTHVRGKGMGENQSLGTFISTEENNRYETPTQKAEKVDVEIENPLVVDDDYGLVGKRQEILNENRDKFTAEDSNDYQDLPKGKLTLDDLNDDGIKKLAVLTTEALKAQGYDSIYFRESDTQEGELVVFDKKKVTFKENNIKLAENNAENEHANSKLTEQDNIEQEPSIKDIEGKAESNNEAELNEVVKKADELISNAVGISRIPLAQLNTDENRFQARDELNQEIVENIAKNFSDADQDPIHVWTDKKDGKTYVLSGHHRYYGAKKAGRVDVKIIDRTNDFTEKEAIKFATEEANANRSMETPLERANTLRKKRENGDSKEEINAFLIKEGKNKSYTDNLSRLNPKGKVIQTLKQLANSADKVTQKEIEKIADWIGEARKSVNGLTDAHENEMFDFLMDKRASERITRKEDFLQKVRSVVNPLLPDQILNLNRFKNKTQGEQSYDEDVLEKKAEISERQKQIDALNDRFSNPANVAYVSTDNANYAQARKIADDKISKLDSERKALQKQLEDIYRNKGKYVSAPTTGTLFQLSDNQDPYTKVVNGFYSPLEKIISETKFDKLPAKQWIEKFAKGEEAKWTGLTDWLNQQQGSVSKTDIQQFLKDNRIQVVEVVNSGKSEKYYQLVEEQKNASRELDILESDLDNWSDENYKESRDKKYELNDKIKELSNQIKEEESKTKDTKFENYQLEGEKENYKEVLVTMPVVSESAKNISEKYWEAAKARDEYKKQNAPRKQGEDIVAYIDRANAELKNDAKYQELTKNAEVLNKKMDDANKNQGEKFKSSHFDEPNILVHLRMNTRVDSDGNKVLFLEEVQSDWGQKGKKEGFELTSEEKSKLIEEHRGILSELQDIDAKIIENVESGNKDKSAYDLAQQKIKLQEKSEKLKDQIFKRKPPTAPFVTDTNAWTKLGLKVALKEAVKQGADKIAWTTGEQQNDRYDLSKQVDWINAEKTNKGDYKIEVGHKDNRPMETQYLKENELEANLGKELATKIINDGGGMYRGLDLKVGGKGMKGFYGSPAEGSLGIVGNVAKSLFKQEPKPIELQTTSTGISTQDKVLRYRDWVWKNKNEDFSYNDAQKDIQNNSKLYQEYQKNIPTQHSIDITPEMRAEVQGKGQPLFVLSNAKDQKPFETNNNTKATKENLTKTFPDAVVVQSESELPQAIQSEIKQQRAEGKVKGVFYNGKIYMVADNIKTIGEATGTYRHEKLGHKGVISYLKDKLDTYATRIIDNAKGEQLGKLKQLAKRYGFPIDLTKLTPKQKSDLGQEYIAMISENKSKYPKLWNDLVSFVREMLRKLPFLKGLQVTDTEIQSLIGKVEKMEKTNNDLSKSGKSQFQLSEDTSQKFDPKNKIHVEYSDMLNEYVDISIEEGVVPTLELLKSEIDEETFDEIVSELGIPFIEGKFNTPFIQNLKLENLSKEQKDNPLVERAQITLGEDARQELDEIGRTYTADKWKEIEPQVDAFVQRVLGSRNFNESVLEIIQWMKDMPMSTYLNEDGIATAHTMILNKLAMHAYTLDKELFKEVFKFAKIRATSFGQAIAAYAEASTPESLFNNAIAAIEIEKEEILNTVQPNGKTLKQELDLILEQISIKADEITEVLNAIDATTQNVANKTKGKTNKPSGSKPSTSKTKSNFVPRSKEEKAKAKVKIDDAKARLAKWLEKQSTLSFAYDPNADLKAHQELLGISKDFVLGFLQYGYSSILNIKEKLQAVLGKNANVDDFWHEVYDEEVRLKVKDLEKEQIVNAIVNAIKGPGDAKEVNAISQISRILAGVARNKGKSDKTTVPIEEKVRLLFENKDMASDAVEEALRIGIEQIENNPNLSDAQKLERVKTLQDLASNFTVVPESVSRKAIQAGLKDIKETIESIAKKHYLDAEDAKQSLIDKLVLNAGLSHEDAKEYADILSNELDKQIGEKKAKLLNKLLNPTTKKTGNKKEIEKIIDAINLGALSTDEFASLFAKKYGFRALTPQQVQFLQNTISIMFQQKGIMRRRIARTLADYIASLKPLDARNIGMLIQEVFYQHALGGINTVAMNIPIGSTLSVMANMIPVIIKNPQLFIKANLAYNRAGLGGTGIKAFIDTIQTGFNDVDNFVDEKNFLTSGSRYHKFLLSWGFKDPQNFITSVLYKLPMHIGYFASAFDNLINHRGGEILNYMHEYQSTDKSYLTIKEIHKQVEAKMGYDDAKNYSTIVDDEILDMKANGLTIPTGYKEQRVKELMVETRDRDIQQQSYRLIRSYGLMGKPDGISGAIYRAIAPAGIINDKDSNLTAVVKTIASITLLPFLRISFASMGMLASGIPIVGMGLGSYKLEKNEKTKRNEFSFKSAEELKQLAGIQVMTISALIFGFMEMFDMEDDEEGNTVLSLNKNRMFDITGTNISFFDQDKMQLDKGNYLPLSIRFRKSDGTWGKLHEAGRYMPPIVAVMSILGNLRDKIEIQSLSKLDEEGQIKTTYANKEMVFESLMSIYGGLTVTSYNSLAQFAGKSADIIGYKNKSPQIQSDKKIEDTKKLLFNTIARPVKTLALPNIYRDATKNTEALLGSQKTMDSQYKNILKDFYGLDHLTNHKEVDIFGNKVMQTASFGEDDRYNLPEWKLLRERNITFDTPYFYKTAKFDGEKKNITNEQRLKLNDKASIAFGNYIRENIEYLNGLNQVELIQEFDNYADQAKRDITSLDFNEAIK